MKTEERVLTKQDYAKNYALWEAITSLADNKTYAAIFLAETLVRDGVISMSKKQIATECGFTNISSVKKAIDALTSRCVPFMVKKNDGSYVFNPDIESQYDAAMQKREKARKKAAEKIKKYINEEVLRIIQISNENYADILLRQDGCEKE